MAFYTGNFASFAALKSSVEATLTGSEGWTSSSGILSKNGMYIRLTATTDTLTLEMGNSQTGATLNEIASCKIMSHVGAPIGFPGNYDLHSFTAPDEVFLVINYNADRYQQLSWGKTGVSQVGGSGNWLSGAFNVGKSASVNQKIFMQQSGEAIGPSFDGMGCGLFFESAIVGGVQSSAIHTALDTTAWRSTGTGVGALHGSADCVAGLLCSLPSSFNQNTVLLPLNVVQKRLDHGLTIVASMNNARLCRIDNHLSGEVVTYGGVNWKVYPFHRKNADQRNGVPWSTGADHSGTFGYAIRYTGP